MSNPTLKLEAGKYYHDRRGKVIGPIQPNHGGDPDWPFRVPGTGRHPIPSYYRADGTWSLCEDVRHERDLVSECDSVGDPETPATPATPATPEKPAPGQLALKAGSFYRTKSGRIVGPVVPELDGVLVDDLVEVPKPGDAPPDALLKIDHPPEPVPAAPSEYDQLVARFASRVSNQAGHQLRQESIQVSTQFCDAVCRLDPRALRRIDWFKLVDVPEGTDFSTVLVDLVFEACREHYRTQALRDIANSAQISLAPDRLAE